MDTITQLSSTQRKLIQNYVNDLFNEKVKLLEKYYDVDAGLTLSDAVVSRLAVEKRTKKISHTDFWNQISK